MNSTFRGPWPRVRARIGRPCTEVPTASQPSALVATVVGGLVAGVAVTGGGAAAVPDVVKVHPHATTDVVMASRRAAAARAGCLTAPPSARGNPRREEIHVHRVHVGAVGELVPDVA